MASMPRGQEPDLGVMLCRWERKHGIGNKRVVLRRDDQRGNGDRVQHMAGSRTIIIILSVTIAAVRRCISVIKVADSCNQVHPCQIPSARQEGSFPTESRLEPDKKMSMVQPVSPFLQGSDALRRIDIRTNGEHSCQCRFRGAQLTGRFQHEVAAHGVADQPYPFDPVTVGQFVDDCPVITAQATVIERWREMLRSPAGSLVHSHDVKPLTIGFGRDRAHVVRVAATL